MLVKIGIDIDGVLAEFVKPFSERANELFGKTEIISTHQVTEWDWLTGPENGLTRHEEQHLWSSLEDEWWYGLPSILSPGEQHRFQEVCKEQEVYAVTNRHRRLQRVTERWLASQGFHAQTVVTNNKPKELHLYEIGYFLDDRPDNVYELREAGIECHTRDWRYNWHVEGPRAYSLHQWLDHLGV